MGSLFYCLKFLLTGVLFQCSLYPNQNRTGDHMKVFEVLEKLEQEGPEDCEYGICSNLKFGGNGATYRVWAEFQVECFRAWEKFSGNEVYPVPSTNPRIPPGQTFDTTSEAGMWSVDTQYGQSRWALLYHCIKWFKERDL